MADQMSINLQYPYDGKYDYFTEIKRINLDKQRDEDIKSGVGFLITEPKGIKKDVKLQNGIFSSRYGSNSISDTDSFSGRYRCKCGLKRGSINNGEYCDVCGTRVTYVDDDVSITGYLKLKDRYWIIHPNLYYTIEQFIGSGRLQRIIEPDVQVDCNGNEIPIISVKKDEPFKGIGLLEFHERFDEIMSFYLAKYPTKKLYYDNIMQERENVWTHTISIYSSLLRPSSLDNGSLKYEDCNDQFNMLASLVYKCNDDALEIDRKIKERLNLLYDIQVCVNTVYTKIKEILAKKKGDIRTAIGGRYCFSSRSVIKQDPTLRSDEVRLPFAGLCEMLQQVIINILVRSYSFNYSDAYKRWYKAQVIGFDQAIYDIIDGLIKDKNGLPVLINRNPTISYGGILACRCIGINRDYTMSISLLVLKALAADFDGDTLNILYLYNKDFIRLAERIINPKYMYIDRNTGTCNADFIHSRDTIINANSLKSLYHYSPEQIERIRALQAMD
jgi:hypothetical protein